MRKTNRYLRLALLSLISLLLFSCQNTGNCNAPATPHVNWRGCDKSGVNLQSANLESALLRGANLSGANLKGADLRNASLTETDLTDANLVEANLSMAKLVDVQLNNADLSKTLFEDANLTNANLHGTTLVDTNFRNADLSSANLQGVDATSANFDLAYLADTDFTDAQIADKWRFVSEIVTDEQTGQDLSDVDLSHADLSQAQLQSVNLRETNLSGTDLSGANLDRVAFHDAKLDAGTVIAPKWRTIWDIVTNGAEGRDLNGQDLSNADLSDADLRSANLTDANLENTNLVGADLTGATLDGAILRGTEVDDDTELLDKWVLVRDLITNGGTNRDLRNRDLREAFLEGVNLSGAQLQNADLRASNLREANFIDADLIEAILQSSNLNDANLMRADLSRANLSNASMEEAKLRDTVLNNTTLYSANLSRANLIDADLIEADLRSSTLSDVSLVRADLSRANLSNASMEEAELRDTVLNNATLNGANLSRANLRGADLSQTDMSLTNLNYANLWGANLIGANLDYADLRNARISDTTQIADKWQIVTDIVTNGGANRDLDGLDFARADLAGADLRNCVFINSTLADANLERANLSGSDLRQADLTGTSLRWVNLNDVQMDDTTQIAGKWREVWNIVNQVEERDNLNGVHLRYANLTGLDLTGQHLIGADLSYTILSNTKVISANLSGADFTQADLRNAQLNGTTIIADKWRLVWQIVNSMTEERRNFANVDLSRAYLHNAEMGDFNLRNANLSLCDLTYANLNKANLENANLSGANLSNADLLKAKVAGTILDYTVTSVPFSRDKLQMVANISKNDAVGDNLTGYDLSKTNLSSVVFNHSVLVRTDFSSSDLSGASFENADLSSATLIGTTLSEAYLSGANLYGTDFRNADLTGANLRNSDITDINLDGANLTNVDLTGAEGAENKPWQQAKVRRGLILPDGSQYIPWKTITLISLVTGIALLLFSGGYVMYAYPLYQAIWLDESQSHLTKLMLLTLPPTGELEASALTTELREVGASCTQSQVQEVLHSLRALGILQRNGNLYRHRVPQTAWIHRLLRRHFVTDLAEQVRVKHPLYRKSQSFFKMARLRMIEVEPHFFMLRESSSEHPVTVQGPIYVQFIMDHAPKGEDFTHIYKTVLEYSSGQELSHHVALVISDQRPAPGARYRLYEIRQREGLAIVPLDVSVFDQIEPERKAIDILQSEIDQATGQQNLYAISGPVSSDLSFFGRERVLQEIIDLLNVGQPVGLFGLRKVGKTSVIQRLQGRLTQQRSTALIDAQSTSRQQGIWSFYPDIITAFANHLQRYLPDIDLPELQLWPEAPTPSPALADAFMQDIHALHTALGAPDQDRRLLLIVDEIDRLLPASEARGYEGLNTLLGQLRAANQQANLLDFLVVGVDADVNRVERWQDHDNELYRALREVWMPPMAHDDVSEMIESLGSQMGVRYEPEALNLLASSGGGQPFVTRQLCSRAVQGRLGQGAITVTADQARVAIEEFIFGDPYLREMWDKRLNDTQRKMLRVLAQASEPLPRLDLLPASQRQGALAALGAIEDYTLVDRTDGGYIIAWDVFNKWIRWIELGLED